MFQVMEMGEGKSSVVFEKLMLVGAKVDVFKHAERAKCHGEEEFSKYLDLEVGNHGSAV